MASIQVLLLLMICAWASASSMTDLYNSQVTYAEYYVRPLGTSSSMVGRRAITWNYNIQHAGVVVTTSDRKRWLIHKGPNYGVTSSTIIVEANTMTAEWKRTKCGDVNGHTVNDIMQAGKIRCSYNVVTCNCQHAANGMWALVRETPC